MHRLIFSLLIYVAFINCSLAAPQQIWEFKPQVTPANLWDGKQSNLLSTDMIDWQVNGKAIVMFFNVDGRLWRCFDYFDVAMRYQSSACFRLIQEGD
ncbi:MAG: hypothetical protein PVG20_04130 [Thioalkalispiraceae bacterium]|jgi:hypothetical protein